MTARVSEGKNRTVFFWIGVFVLLIIIAIIYSKYSSNSIRISSATTSRSTSAVAITPLPPEVLLGGSTYSAQSFNNCGPAALSMDLSFYGVNVSQEILADALRPDHNDTGKGDDKSTPPDEIAAQAEQYGLIAYYRPAGSIGLLKQLLAAGFPVIVRTLFMPSDPVAHYRVIKGYDDSTGQITDEDGFQGPNVTYTYANFLSLWKYYSYDYVVLTTPAKQAKLISILGADADAKTAWQHMLQEDQQAIAQNPKDAVATFDLSVADYYTGDYAGSVQAYESSASQVPPDALWYQMEPLESYYELGDYDKVFSISDSIFATNPAYPELYVLRGESYLKEGNTAAARSEFETAISYNKNLQSAKDALAALGN